MILSKPFAILRKVLAPRSGKEYKIPTVILSKPFAILSKVLAPRSGKVYKTPTGERKVITFE